MMRNLLEQANGLFQEQRYPEAEKAYQELLLKEPGNIAALAGMGLSCIKTGRSAEAIDYLSRAIKVAPDNAQLYSERAVAYFHTSALKEALADMDIAQKLEPENPYRYSSRAYIREKAGDTNGAISDYQKAIDLDPEDAIAYNNLGLIQEKMGFKQEAKNNFAKADALEGLPPMPEIEKNSNKNAPETKKDKLQPKLSLTQYLTEVRSVLTTKEGFREFLQFLRKKK